jgi:hypothetical protein
MPEDQERRFRKGPLERRIAALRPRGALALARRFLGTCDEPAVGHTVLDAWEALDGMDVVEEHQTQDVADARHSAEQGQRVGIVVVRRTPHGQLDVPQPRVVVANEGQGHCHPLLDCRVRQACGNPVAVGFVSARLADLRQIVRAIGLLEVRQECRALAHAMSPSPPQVAGRPHLCRRDVGVREPPTAEQAGTLVRLDRSVLGLAPVHRLHGQRMAQHKGKTFTGAEVGQPIPSEETCDTDDQSGPVRRDGFAKRFGASWHVAVPQDLTLLVQDAQVHGAGMQSDTTVKLLLFRVESPEVSSSLERNVSHSQHTTGGMLRRGPQ